MNRPIWCKSKLLLLCFLPVFLCFFAGCGADNKSCIRWVTWKGYMGYSNPADWGFHVKTSTYEGPFISRQSEQGAMFGICAACSEERVIECLKYIELLSTDRKFRDILAYGIEGKHFEY